MKSGATESCFYYLAQHYKIPKNVDVVRTTVEAIQSKNQYKVIWAHDNCDQVGHLHLPENIDKVDLIVCVSHWEREQYIKFNRAPAEKLVVIPNGVHEMFVPSGKPKSKTCIFFSAPHKGVAPLVPIWKKVVEKHPDAHLKVFSSMSLYGAVQPGEGDEETITTENGLEPSPFIPVYKELQKLPNVTYSPCIDREDLLPHIQDAAFYIHPNVWEETFCVSLAEAISCGCYPIATGMGAIPETSFGRGKYIPMSGQNTPRGWLPDQKFHDEFAEEVIRALSFFDKEPETFYAATSELAFIAKNNYNWKNISNLWRDVIDVVTKKGSFIDDNLIFNHVYTKNEYEIETFLNDDVVIDIGAHKGYFTKLCMDKGCKNIHSFEPEARNFEALVNNLKDYNYFQAYNLAVSDIKGEKLFVTVPTGTNTGLHSFYARNGVPITVKTVSLDDILINFKKVSLLKVDTEGSEFEILMNSKLLHKVDKIVGEYHDNLNDQNSKNLFKFLKSKNFKIIKVRPDDDFSGIFWAEKQNQSKKHKGFGV